MADHGRTVQSLDEDPSTGIMDQLKHLIIMIVAIRNSLGPAKLISQARGKSMKDGPVSSRKQPGRPCKLYPFGKYHPPNRYIENNILDITESGASDFIEPCHEYKTFNNTTTKIQTMNKFTYEVICFATACMNSRTNGTIHFGIGDEPLDTYGQVLGVVVEDREAYANELKSAIDRCFGYKHKHIAQICIKPPRFVSVLNKNITSSDKCVIEVDIVPDSAICGENIFHTYNKDTKKARKKAKGKGNVNPETKPQKQFFVRDGGSSSDFFAEEKKYNQFVQPDHIKKLTQLRKQSEEKQLKVIKSSTQGLRLSLEEDPSPGIMDRFKHQKKKTVEILNFLRPAKLNIQARGISTKEEPLSSRKQPGRPCKPYPFGKYQSTNRYIVKNYFDIIESGASDFIEPCHEYKALIFTPDEKKIYKFIYEVIRFAAACMNSRTNGTIHFGIGDKPHGEVLGVVVEDREAYANELKSAIDLYFEHKHKQIAQKCIKPPRFVGVLNTNDTTSDRCVIEVDIVPDSVICGKNIFHTFGLVKDKKEVNGKETKPHKQFFVREGGSSPDFLKRAELLEKYNQFVEPDHIKQLTQLHKHSEEKHLNVIKVSTQGSRLSEMITGGSLSLDKSHFERYVIVTNKSHPLQFKSLGFLGELNPTVILDFDPESAEHGLQCHFKQQSTVSVHLPAKYKITEGVEDIANKLELTRNTSWVFCNGGIEDEVPSEIDEWLMDKGASIRDEISFLCQNDVLQNERFLVIFLLLSTVSDEMDPLVETFCTFYQELKGTEQILCICDNENAFISWRDLIDARCEIDISSRCIYELSLAEVNGTILSLFSKHRLSKNFLTCGGGGKVHLKESVEQSLNALEVHCVKPREKLDFNTVMPNLCSQIKLMYVPIWSLLDTFRCAFLRDCNADFTEVAEQVVTLLMYGHEEQVPRVPVLLMIDDFDDNNKVSDLQQVIDKECAKKGIQGMAAEVIPLESPTNGSNSQVTLQQKSGYTILTQ
ncbi:sterile alpha motif domain-containing protein 9-like [Sparus aurata]|uniref:sterile alpha motif domain-containing protein 9-like n=1 Tax=Sparus aurata TaxID=8175 RepID=UPI0011C17348|nr:sterile alpha motif domain-containing protein 9-like [Sparus aurata]